jgi:hypothetical protein
MPHRICTQIGEGSRENAYAYKKLLKIGNHCFRTDFPEEVNDVDHAAVARKDSKGYPMVVFKWKTH